MKNLNILSWSFFTTFLNIFWVLCCLHSLKKCIRVIPIWVSLFQYSLFPFINWVYCFFLLFYFFHLNFDIPIWFSKYRSNLFIQLGFIITRSDCRTRYESTRFVEICWILWIFIGFITKSHNWELISLIC